MEPIDDVLPVRRFSKDSSNCHHREGLHARHLDSLRNRVRVCVRGDNLPPHQRGTRVELPRFGTTADERACVEAREERVAVHRAERVIQGCEDELGWVYDKLPADKGDEKVCRCVGNVSTRTKMTERKAKSADERPVLTEMNINRRSI